MSNVERLLFTSRGAIEEYILSGIRSYTPGRVLVVNNPRRSEFLRGLAGQYDLYINETCSLNWLCQAAEEIRNKGEKAILVSNYPRNIHPPQTRFLRMPSGEAKSITATSGTSLCLCPTTDISTWCSIYVIGAYSIGYIANVFRSQAEGRESLTTLHVLVYPGDSMLTTSEREKLSGCRDRSECQRLLQEIAEDQERDSNCMAYRGGILVE